MLSTSSVKLRRLDPLMYMVRATVLPDRQRVPICMG
jgi:hypothetical protein